MVTYNVGDRVAMLAIPPTNRLRSFSPVLDITTDRLAVIEGIVVRAEPSSSSNSGISYLEVLTTSYSFDQPQPLHLGGNALSLNWNHINYIDRQLTEAAWEAHLPEHVRSALPVLRELSYPKVIAAPGYITMLRDIMKAVDPSGAATTRVDLLDINTLRDRVEAAGLEFIPLDPRCMRATYTTAAELLVDSDDVAEEVASPSRDEDEDEEF